MDMAPATRPATPAIRTSEVAADADATARAIGSGIGPVPLYQREWDSFVSLAYNIGPQAFCGSTLVRLLHQTPPDYTGACKQILRWDKQADYLKNSQLYPVADADMDAAMQDAWTEMLQQ